MILEKTLVIVVVYNGMRWLPEVIPCLTEDPAVHVWVRDNGSEDGSRDFLKSHPAIQFYSEGGNIGFGKANNLGLSFALAQGYDSVLLLNQDAKVTTGQIKKMRLVASEMNGEFILCPVQLNWDGKEANPNFQNLYAPSWENETKPFTVDFVNAAIWFIPRKTLSLVGGFNPLFFMYGEDNDWVRRLLKQQGNVFVLPTLKCRHDKALGPPLNLKALRLRYENEEVSFFFVRHNSFLTWSLGFLLRSTVRILKPVYAKKFGIAPQIRQYNSIFRMFKENKGGMERVRKEFNKSTPFLNQGGEDRHV